MMPFHRLNDSFLVLSPKTWNGIIYSYHLFVFFVILIPITMNCHYSVPNVLRELESSILMWWTLGVFGDFYLTPCSQINQMSIWFIFSFSPSFYWPLIFFIYLFIFGRVCQNMLIFQRWFSLSLLFLTSTYANKKGKEKTKDFVVTST